MNLNAEMTRRAGRASESESLPLAVTLASGFFMLKGGLMATAITIALLVPLSSAPMLAGAWPEPWLLALSALYAASQLWISTLLWRRSRLGGWLAAALIVLPLALSGGSLGMAGVLDAVVIASTWGYLE